MDILRSNWCMKLNETRINLRSFTSQTWNWFRYGPVGPGGMVLDEADNKILSTYYNFIYE